MKRIISLILTVSIIICAFSCLCGLDIIAVENNVHSHCVCGGYSGMISNHTCTANIWTAWDGTKDDITEELFLYLTKDTTMNAQFSLGVGQKVHICLNGYTLYSKSGSRAFRPGGYGTTDNYLDICDCSVNHTGKIVCSDMPSDHSTFMMTSKTVRSFVNFYNITVNCGNAGKMYAGISANNKATINIYGSTIIGGTVSTQSNGMGGNIFVSTDAVVSLYDTTVKNGSATLGGNIYVANGGTLNLFGNCNITGAVSGGGIYSDTGSVTNVSGKPIISNNNGGNFLQKGELNILGILQSDSNIGVTKCAKNFITKSDTEYSNVFVSDKTNEQICYESTTKEYIFVDKNDYSNKKIDIYMLGGQSNAVGTSHISSGSGVMPTYSERNTNEYDNVKYYEIEHNIDGTVKSDYSGIVSVKEGLGFSSDCIGPELGMASVLSKKYQGTDTDVLIFKHAIGGTSLLQHQNSDGSHSNPGKFLISGSWYPESLDVATSLGENRPTGYILREFKKNIVNLYNTLLAKGYKAENINFVSFSWMQGEADRFSPTAYETAFIAMINEIRGKVSAVTGKDYSDLRIVVGKISNSYESAKPSDIEINKAFIAMQSTLPTKITNLVCVDSNDFEMNSYENNTNTVLGSDSYHFKYSDMLKLGQMFANPDNVHSHCVCGDNFNGKFGHNCGSDIAWVSWNGSVNTTDKEVYYYLTKDTTLSGQWTLSSGQKVHICLNGFQLTCTKRAFLIGYNSGGANVLDICDCSPSGTGNIKCATISDHSNFILYFTNADKTSVNIYNSTVHGGTSLGNSYGAVSMANKGEFNLYGSEITGGTTKDGTNCKSGNVAVVGGAVVNLYDSKVTNGYCSVSGWGGNMVVYKGGTLNMFGNSEISGAVNGGGVIAISGSIINLYDKAVIKNNVGGNLSLPGDSPITAKNLTDGAEIYVKQSSVNYNKPFANCDESLLKYFKSDNSSYQVRYGNISNQVYLVIAGDTDTDKSVTIQDASKAADYIVGNDTTLTEYQIISSDINGDSVVDVLDVLAVLKSLK